MHWISTVRPRHLLAVALAAALPLQAQGEPSQAGAADFYTAVEAYGEQQFSRCAEVLTALRDAGDVLPQGGDLLLVECIAAAGDLERAAAQIRLMLPAGTLDLQELKEKDRPGLAALRASSHWPPLLAEVTQLQAATAAKLDTALRDELLRREAADQRVQQAAIDAGGGAAWQSTVPVADSNTAWFKQVLADKGWPGISTVGRDGAAAAWLIVQHSDRDPAFQDQALALMAVAVDQQEAEPGKFALLTDRVRVAQGKPQVYGTQFKTNAAGAMVLQPTEDLPGLDARRRQMGLPTLAQYKQQLAEAYNQPVE